jgi:oligopeptide/dipeptide ABC transporter ATP-binding protein
MPEAALLSARGLVKVYRQRGTGLPLAAVDGVDLEVHEGEVVGLVGETGSGKTTLGKLLVNLEQPDKGEIFYRGERAVDKRTRLPRRLRSKLSMIFQDPYEALNPAKTVYDIVALPARAQGLRERREIEPLVRRALEDVRLSPPEDFLSKYPSQLSGGQRQRVAIARAIVLRPEFLVADEPTSMLDASLKLGIINLLYELTSKYRMAMLLITHDLAVVSLICRRILVMYRGSIVESGPRDLVISRPRHPYTQALIASIPSLEGELGPPALRPGQEGATGRGCKFYSRCPLRFARCEGERPQDFRVEESLVKCFLYDKEGGGERAA